MKSARYRPHPYLSVSFEDGKIVFSQALAGKRVKMEHPWLLKILAGLSGWRSRAETVAVVESVRGMAGCPDLEPGALIRLLYNERLLELEGDEVIEPDWKPEVAQAFATIHRHRVPVDVLEREEDSSTRSSREPTLALEVKETKLALSDVMSARCSSRDFHESPITFSKLSALMSNSLMPAGSGRMRYPSAGGLYPIRALIAIARVDGVEAGLYEYRPSEHDLIRLPEGCEAVDDGVAWAQGTIGGQGVGPAAVVFFIADFGAPLSRYGPLALSLLNKDVGAMIEGLYLAAAAAELGVCAIGAPYAPIEKYAWRIPAARDSKGRAKCIGALALGMKSPNPEEVS